MVAIKILKRGTSIDFLVKSEIDIMKRLHHSNIIQLFQVIEARYKTYLVMEYASRGSLRKHISKCGRLDEEEARSIFRELSLAVHYIHSQNIAHRDIKAENILLDREGHVKLIDFGLSKRLAAGEKCKGFCGTVQYCAPEVLDKKEYNVLATDIWSMGIVLYYLVVGHLPFTETVLSELKYEILYRSCWIPYHLSPEIQDLLKGLMTKDPTMRPSINEILTHPWLCHDQDKLRSSEEIPRDPDPNIAFAMFQMGCKIKELRDALREQKYSPAMATYLIIKQKSTWQAQFYHDRGHGGLLDPTKAANINVTLRRVNSAHSLSIVPSHTRSKLLADGRKGCKRRHSVPPSLSCHDCSFMDNTSPLRWLMPHIGKGRFREKEGISNSTTSSGKRKLMTTTTMTTTTTTIKITTTSSGTTYSLFTSSQSSAFDNTQDVASESAESTDKSSSSSSWGSTTRSPFPSAKFQEENIGTSSSTWSWGSTTRRPFPSAKFQEENIGTESLQESSSSSSTTDHQEQLRRRSQPVPRMPLRMRVWKGLKKRVSNAFRRLCCCLPVGNSEIVPVDEKCFRDTG
ncbi:sperm motility kinase X-like [Apodemus sylvaticus]|uniref:sperm motility kinase X-like n=1 Tax=Apodemus sylvaticus TaxID=10129 RepID=UPI002244F024|nr:sperm motility kinase X-like [Apodemus sylvaticus]